MLINFLGFCHVLILFVVVNNNQKEAKRKIVPHKGINFIFDEIMEINYKENNKNIHKMLIKIINNGLHKLVAFLFLVDYF